ncbi:toxin-antitoxin system HicB family antitoxin (plasmid) [Gluconobacter sphaericus]|uniref:toxin-antitoxin system HicB family antitoxin n=1 Tax=Gluconobacter sphaericus TaxID=574987 RepID=UPI001922C3E9|nr:toxin-antitoxin system HicB family antitoxin [Gluconobacter sphaericus]QQX92816.1 toxin-antitoxin system HicB family antitoxin [Gluconobacter sphaericus]
MNSGTADDRNFSGRFQIRLSPEHHKMLFEYARSLNASMNDIIELALSFAISTENFNSYADDRINGLFGVVGDNHMPLATLAFRNFLSYDQLDSETVRVRVRRRNGSVWGEWIFEADLKKNPNLLAKLKSWDEARNFANM